MRAILKHSHLHWGYIEHAVRTGTAMFVHSRGPNGTLVVEDAMNSRSSNYKEVLFGAAFGAGASLIDVAMHNTMAHRGFIEELLHPEPAMALYRALFVILGIGLGVVLWQRNRRERDYRHLTRALAELRSCVAAPSVLIHTNLQLLLAKHIDTVPDQVAAILRSAYEHSVSLQRVLSDQTIERLLSELPGRTVVPVHSNYSS